jgi:RHS repeat-associated protein
MAMVDGSGTVVKTYGYDVYGKVTSSSGSAPNEFDFAAQQTDPTGLQYLRARYYDPGTGTFLSRDPMMLAPGWGGNPFGYGNASPCNLIDPSGFAPKGWKTKCDDLFTKLENAVNSLVRAADNWLNNDWGGNLDEVGIRGHLTNWDQKQRSLTKALDGLNDPDNNCPSKGFYSKIVKLSGEYLRGKSIGEVAGKLKDENESGKSKWSSITSGVASGWEAVVDALDEVEEGLKDWEPSGAPFGPPIPGGVPPVPAP